MRMVKQLNNCTTTCITPSFKVIFTFEDGSIQTHERTNLMFKGVCDAKRVRPVKVYVEFLDEPILTLPAPIIESVYFNILNTLKVGKSTSDITLAPRWFAALMNNKGQ